MHEGRVARRGRLRRAALERADLGGLGPRQNDLHVDVGPRRVVIINIGRRVEARRRRRLENARVRFY